MAAIANASTYTAPARWSGVVRCALAAALNAGTRPLLRSIGLPVRLRATGFAARIEPLKQGNPDLAARFYRGRFAFAGRVLECDGRSIFDHDVRDRLWSEELHGFAWLSHLRAGGREISRAQARALVSDWISHSQRAVAPAHDPQVASRRLISWIQNAGFLLQGASGFFSESFLKGLTLETRRLAARARLPSSPEARLHTAIALAHSAFAVRGFESLKPLAEDRLSRELARQILPDGGHVSRNPAVLLNVLSDLLPLRHALEASDTDVPEQMHIALERMMPMLRFFCHGDGGLALFNGVNATMNGRARAVSAVDETGGRPLDHAPYSGYCRLSKGQSLVVADTGKPPAPGLNPGAASAPLAFEFSHGACRIVVNCGAPQAHHDNWIEAAATTAAHSTVCVGETCTGRVLSGAWSRALFGTPVVMGPGEVTCVLDQAREGVVMHASHNGYGAAYRVRIERRLFLSQNGKDFRGEDSFPTIGRAGKLPDGVPFAIRFHLHPGVKATLSQDSASVMLAPPSGGGWRFSARGGEIKLEDSVYLADERGPRRTRQIVIHGKLQASARVNWAFKHIRKTRAASRQSSAAPELPF